MLVLCILCCVLGKVSCNPIWHQTCYVPWGDLQFLIPPPPFIYSLSLRLHARTYFVMWFLFVWYNSLTFDCLQLDWVTHALNPSREAEAGRCLSLSPAWSVDLVLGQQELHKETLSQNIKTDKQTQNILTVSVLIWPPISINSFPGPSF